MFLVCTKDVWSFSTQRQTCVLYLFGPHYDFSYLLFFNNPMGLL